MNWGMIRESNMLAALSVGAGRAVFMWEEIGSFSYLDVQLGRKDRFFLSKLVDFD